MALDARCKIGRPNSCSINCGMDSTLEASVQHHSLKAEHPGETEASKSQSDETHNTLTLRVSNWQTAAVINSKTYGLMTLGRDREKIKRYFGGRRSIIWARNNTQINVKTGGDSSTIREDEDNEERAGRNNGGGMRRRWAALPRLLDLKHCRWEVLG